MKYIVCLFLSACILGVGTANAQYAKKYNNSLRLQYGLYQYNNSQSGFLNDANDNFLSLGLTYRHQLSRISGVNITGRYYQWNLDNNTALKTYAAQALWVFHPRRISNSWKVNRLTPYLGVGAGFEKHNLEFSNASDTSFSNLYIPIEAGVLINLSSRWSLGVYAEYKVASAKDLKKAAGIPEGNMDILNSAGVSLAWNFGHRKKTYAAPVIFTDPYQKIIPEIKTLPAEQPANKLKIKIGKEISKDSIKIKTIVENISLSKDSIVDEIKSINRIGVTTTVSDSFLILVKEAILSEKTQVVTDSSTTVSKNKKPPAVQTNKKQKALKKDSIPTVLQIVKTDSSMQVVKDSIHTDSLKLKVNNTETKQDSILKISVPESKINNTDSLSRPKSILDSSALKENTPLQKKTESIELKDASQLNKPEQKKNEINSIDDKDVAIETLLDMIGQLNARIDGLENQESTVVVNNEITPIHPMEHNAGEAAVITGLKQSYNLLGEVAQYNYSRGRMNEQGYQKISTDAVDLKEKINTLSEENEVAFDELAIIFETLYNLQHEIENTPTEKTGVQQNIQKDNFLSIQGKLDKTLQELDQIKNGRLTENKTALIDSVVKSQDSLRLAVARMENQNIKLSEDVQKLNQVMQLDSVQNSKTNIIYTVKFDVNSTIVTSKDKVGLSKKIKSLKLNKNSMLLLSGFTDITGNAAYNKILSQKRAAAVKVQLIKNGIPDEILLERYFGSSKASDNSSANDRKVVIRILHQ